MAYYDQITMMRLGLGRWSGHGRAGTPERRRWQGRKRQAATSQVLERGKRQD
ncbi:hypothetical protein RXV86_19330 [Alisedimentitalea sp. MJ-SS2]|uniref:hypothetical protein n=1 Tax=Aliisedimentitalea sp. MJ-SS2 TaxID=3049795 RepID=UPI00290E3DFA|nr:hypothetical protein [Alisedimentitalea sp. MJ-SS2]MDU8929548.1 hypothetical protein [Alisedimentitalea sp. MJ-SS2]